MGLKEEKKPQSVGSAPATSFNESRATLLVPTALRLNNVTIIWVQWECRVADPNPRTIKAAKQK